MLFITKPQWLLVFFLSFHVFVFSQNPDTNLNLDKKNLALSGYDLIEYYNNKAIKGNSKHESIHEGARYHFKSLKNKLLFEKNPLKYTPQYGGWCAYAMGYNGEKVSVNPESFSIENDKLYLFYKTFFNDTKSKWNKNTAELKNNAEENWNKLLNSPKNENKY